MATLEAAAGAGASASAGAITMRRPLVASVHVAPVVDDALAAARETLIERLLSGVSEVQHGDKRTRFRAQTELAQALAAANALIANAGRPAIKTIVFNCSKGLE